MNIYLQRLILGLFLNLLLALGAYKKNAITPSGGYMGILLGTLIYLGGGLFFWLHLGAFFLSSTLLGKFSNSAKAKALSRHSKDGRRDAVQVVSNIGPGALAALLYLFFPHPSLLAAFAASFAAANADTWAGEIGMLASRPPVSIISRRPLVSGSSGGVTSLGFLASLAGAIFIAGFFLIGHIAVFGFTYSAVLLALIAAGAGFFESLIDSILGATVQAGYISAVTNEPTERPYSGGQSNLIVKGYAHMDNDAVNLLSVSAAAVLGALIPLFFPR